MFIPQDIRLYEAYRSDPNYEILISGQLKLRWTNDVAGRHTWSMHARISGIRFYAFGAEFRMEIDPETHVATIAWDYLARHRMQTDEHIYPIPEDVWRGARSLDDVLRSAWCPGPRPTPSGVPWEITMLPDAVARASALDAFWANV